MLNRTNKVAVVLMTLALFLVSSAFAHEGGKHVLGTVKSIDSDAITVVTTKNETVTVKVLPTTKFIKSGQPSSLQDLKAGERVVIHAKQNGTSLEAEQVQFGVSAVHSAH